LAEVGGVRTGREGFVARWLDGHSDVARLRFAEGRDDAPGPALQRSPRVLGRELEREAELEGLVAAVARAARSSAAAVAVRGRRRRRRPRAPPRLAQQPRSRGRGRGRGRRRGRSRARRGAARARRRRDERAPARPAAHRDPRGVPRREECDRGRDRTAVSTARARAPRGARPDRAADEIARAPVRVFGFPGTVESTREEATALSFSTSRGDGTKSERRQIAIEARRRECIARERRRAEDGRGDGYFFFYGLEK